MLKQGKKAYNQNHILNTAREKALKVTYNISLISYYEFFP